MFKHFNYSMLGSSHWKRGETCQDFSSVLEFSSTLGLIQIIMVADGHGNERHFRSQIGAKLAAKAVFSQSKIFLANTNSKNFSNTGIKNFKFAVLKTWYNLCMEDWKENPPSADEPRWEKFKANFNLEDQNILDFYGTTLICAISIGTQVLILQIGDGTCVILRKDGKFQIPLPNEEKPLNVTDSMCNADCKFRHAVLNSPIAPIAIFLMTDGFENSFSIFDNQKQIFNCCDSIIEAIVKNGMAQTRHELKTEVLPYLTEKGSHDDISLALLITEDFNLLNRVQKEMRAD